MKLLKLSTVAIIVISTFLVSCEEYGFIIYGEGDVVTETLALEDFTSIELIGADDVYISYGENQEVTVTGNANIIDRLKTDVFGNTWKIELEHGNYHDYELTIYITMPDIAKIGLIGSGNVEVYDFINQGDLDLSITGSGDIDLNKFENCPTLNVNITGSGNVLAKDEFAELQLINIDILGSGSFIGYPAESIAAYIDVVGSGSCFVSTSDVLDVKISGSGDVYYKGNPEVELHVTGSGNVISKN